MHSKTDENTSLYRGEKNKSPTIQTDRDQKCRNDKVDYCSDIHKEEKK